MTEAVGPAVYLAVAPYPAGFRHPTGLVGTLHVARCECGWPEPPCMPDRQTKAEAERVRG